MRKTTRSKNASRSALAQIFCLTRYVTAHGQDKCREASPLASASKDPERVRRKGIGASARPHIAALESALKQAQRRAAPSMSSREDLKARNVDLESEVISLRRALKQAQAAKYACEKNQRRPRAPQACRSTLTARWPGLKRPTRICAASSPR